MTQTGSTKTNIGGIPQEVVYMDANSIKLFGCWVDSYQGLCPGVYEQWTGLLDWTVTTGQH